jgi:hypothetical protein
MQPKLQKWFKWKVQLSVEAMLTRGRRLGDVANIRSHHGASMEIDTLYEIVFDAVPVPGEEEETRRMLSGFQGFSNREQFNGARRRMAKIVKTPI